MLNNHLVTVKKLYQDPKMDKKELCVKLPTELPTECWYHFVLLILNIVYVKCNNKPSYLSLFILIIFLFDLTKFKLSRDKEGRLPMYRFSHINFLC